jgi:outer membrane lipase/esterase
MNFRINQWSAAALRSGVVAVAVLGSVLLGSCGGASSTHEFAPKRLLVFGDESSLLTRGSAATARDGKKYSINGFTPGTTPAYSTPDCGINPLWVQWLATTYNLVFAECNYNGAAVTAFNYATAGATVAVAVGQVNAWLNQGNSFGSTDLVTVLVGQNDIIALYEAYKALPTDQQTTAAQNQLVAEALNRGKTLAALFTNVITNNSNSKARALYVVIPDVGKTPYGLSQSDGGALLSRMTFGVGDNYDGFNLGLRNNIANNGRSLGLVDGYNLFYNLVNNTQNYANNNGIYNMTNAGCLPANRPAYDPLNPSAYCNSTTLVNPGVAYGDSYYLWADQIHFGVSAHLLLGERARALAQNNPF